MTHPTKPVEGVLLSVFRRLLPLVLLLVLACSLRLYRVTNPLLDSHHWRQCTSASTAWHYYYTDGNFFHPKESGWGAKPKPFMNEFPLFEYLVSTLYRVAGVHEVLGRLLSIFFSLVGLVFLYTLARKYLGDLEAVCASCLYAVFPISIYYSRTFQRQTMSICFALAAIWFFALLCEKPNRRNLLLWVGSTALALLLNPPTVWACAPMAFLAVSYRPGRWWKSIDFYLGGGAIIILVVSWYLYAFHSGDAWSLKPMNREGFRDFTNPKYYTLWMSKIFFSTVGYTLYEFVLTPFGLLFTLIGLFIPDRSLKLFTLSFLVGVFVYFCLDVFPIALGIHDYYYINAVPALALCGGKGLAFLWRRFAVWPRCQLLLRMAITVGLISIVCLAFSRGKKDQYAYIKDWGVAAKEVDLLIPKNALILVDQDSTAVNYYCHREGWRTMQHHLAADASKPGCDSLLDFLDRGVRYFLITDIPGYDKNKDVSDYVNKHGRLIVESPHHYLFEFPSSEEKPK